MLFFFFLFLVSSSLLLLFFPATWPPLFFYSSRPAQPASQPASCASSLPAFQAHSFLLREGRKEKALDTGRWTLDTGEFATEFLKSPSLPCGTHLPSTVRTSRGTQPKPGEPNALPIYYYEYAYQSQNAYRYCTCWRACTRASRAGLAFGDDSGPSEPLRSSMAYSGRSAQSGSSSSSFASSHLGLPPYAPTHTTSPVGSSTWTPNSAVSALTAESSAPPTSLRPLDLGPPGYQATM